jgi:4-hydroxy-3-methylbut-2-enyl diphosphate reductase
MIGDRNHPEVQGVIAYAPNVIVVDRKEDLATALPRHGKLGVVAQTTHAPEHVGEIVGAMVAMPFREIKVVNTLCLEVIRRQQAVVELCREVNVMFVLGGLHSANTRELARLCREQGMDTYHLETWEAFRPEMVTGKTIAGVTAGASTPEWVINDFVERLGAFQPPAR